MDERPNFILIVIDTLRAQNMSCYGYRFRTSPVMDGIAREGTRFAWAFTESPPTQPSFTAMLTGTNPIVNNIPSHILLRDCVAGWKERAPEITPGVKMLPQLMQENGYKTYAVDNLVMMRPHFGWGYDEYIYSSIVGGEDKRTMVTADQVNAHLLPLLERIKDERFFVFVHYWDPHAPYVPPKEFQRFMATEKDESQMMREMIFQGRDLSWEDFIRSESPVEDPEIWAKYNGEIAYVDDRLGRVLNLMRELGLEEDTVVVVTSDHGESFGIHNVLGHCGLHDTIIRVPLIFRGPSIPSSNVVDAFARHVDIVPTLFGFAGVDFREPYPLSGISLKPVIMGQATETVDAVYACECTQQKTRAMRTRKWKFIKSMEDEPRMDMLPPRELYDLENDPWEEENLIDDRGDVAADLEKRMEAWLEEECRRAGRREDIILITPRGTRPEEYRDLSR